MVPTMKESTSLSVQEHTSAACVLINGSTFSENPTTDVLVGESPEFKTSKLFLYFIILAFSSLGNGLVFCLISCNRRLRQASSNRLLLNLSACDFLTPLLSIPFDLALEERSYVWPYGAIMCRMLWPATTFTATASALTLAGISLDRFRLLMHPFTPRLTKRQITFLISSVHILSAVVVVPYVIVLKLEDHNCGEAWPNFTSRQAYTVILFLVQYALPLSFMTAMYTLALTKLYNVTSNTTKMRSRGEIHRDRESNNSTERGRGVVRKISSRVAKSMRRGFEVESNVRVTKLFIVIVAIFAVFMLPNQVLWLWSDFGGGHTHQDLNSIKIICWLFTYTNCVCNPVIFMIFCKEFRAELAKIPKKLCSNGPRPQLSLSRSSGPPTQCIPMIECVSSPNHYQSLDDK